MNLFDLTITQLKRATTIKEQIETLNIELRSLLSGSAKSGAAPKTKRTTSVSVKSATRSTKPAAKPKKSTMSPATRAKLSRKLKAFWAAKKAGKKQA